MNKADFVLLFINAFSLRILPSWKWEMQLPPRAGRVISRNGHILAGKRAMKTLSPAVIYEPVAAASGGAGPGTRCQGACNIHVFFLLLAGSPGSRRRKLMD